MKFKLVSLEGYITCHLPLSNQPTDQDWDACLSHHEQHLRALFSRSRIAIMDDLVKIGRRGKRRNYAALHAHVLIGLAEKIRQYYTAAGRSTPVVRRHLAPFYFRVGEAIAQLLLLIKNTAPAHFDQTLPVPFTHVGGYRQRFSALSRSLQSLKGRLDNNTAPVVDIVLERMRQCMASPDQFSFERGHYFTELLGTLSRIEEKPGVNLNLQLHVGLITYNFNAPDYIFYCNMKLVEKYDAKQPEQKLEVLLWYHVKLSQVVPLDRYHLFADYPSAQRQLHGWVHQEIIHLQSILSPIVAPAVLPIKIHTNLSVAQIATLAEVGMQMGLLPHKTKAEVYRAISACLTSKGSEQISVVSLASKANNPSAFANASLIELVLKVLAELRKHP